MSKQTDLAEVINEVKGTSEEITISPEGVTVGRKVSLLVIVKALGTVVKNCENCDDINAEDVKTLTEIHKHLKERYLNKI